MSRDRKVRVFTFLTGKLHRVFDESLDIFTEQQQVRWWSMMIFSVLTNYKKWGGGQNLQLSKKHGDSTLLCFILACTCTCSCRVQYTCTCTCTSLNFFLHVSPLPLPSPKNTACIKILCYSIVWTFHDYRTIPSCQTWSLVVDWLWRESWKRHHISHCPMHVSIVITYMSQTDTSPHRGNLCRGV